jgi:hypothetical protein
MFAVAGVADPMVRYDSKRAIAPFLENGQNHYCDIGTDTGVKCTWYFIGLLVAKNP